MRGDFHSKEHKALREILQRERKAANLRQSDLAKATKRSQAYISKFESGELRLDVIDFLKFCSAIGCDPHAILDEIIQAAA